MYEWTIIVPSFRLNRVSYHDIVRQLRKNLNKLDNYNLYTVNTHTHTHTHTRTHCVLYLCYVCLGICVLNHPSISHVHMAWSHKHWETWTGFTVRVRFSSVQLLNRVRLFATPLNAARQASLMCIKGRNCKNNILMVMIYLNSSWHWLCFFTSPCTNHHDYLGREEPLRWLLLLLLSRFSRVGLCATL